MGISLNDVIFTLGKQDITLLNILLATLAITLSASFYWLVAKKWLIRNFKKFFPTANRENDVVRITGYIFVLLALLGTIVGMDLNRILLSNNWINLRVTNLVYALLMIQIARLVSWTFIRLLHFQYNKIRNLPIAKGEHVDDIPSKTVSYFTYLLAGIIILKLLKLDHSLYTLNKDSMQITIFISSVLKVLIIIVVVKLLVWVLSNFFLYNYFKKKGIDYGAQYAAIQLMTYILYVGAGLMAMDSLGIPMTVIWGGAAALLVGIGLGLQQTFNDFFSGLLLLFERSVVVGDVLELDQKVGKVRQIGLRTSMIETRDNITLVVPNSKLITSNVINWSHFDDKVRFKLSVGVAYKSDTKLVKELLLQAAAEHKNILKHPEPFVRFIAFGDFQLQFELLFFSRKLMPIEDTISDLNFRIDQLFRENQIEIPFPQHDIWYRNR